MRNKRVFLIDSRFHGMKARPCLVTGNREAESPGSSAGRETSLFPTFCILFKHPS
jgi:hypothetical protein